MHGCISNIGFDMTIFASNCIQSFGFAREYMVLFHIDELAILEPLQLSSRFSNGDSLIIVVVGITLNH
jgi:hypothetical protein